MKNSLGKLLKISSIALVTILFLCSMFWGVASANIKRQSASVSENEQSQSTNALAEQLFERIYLDDETNSDVYASNVSEAGTSFGTNMKLVDFDISQLGDAGMDYFVVVAFVNLARGSVTWEQSDIDAIMQSLNDDDPNNNVYSVREYFKEQTYGKLRFKAGYVIKTSSAYFFDEFNGLSTSDDASLAYTREAGAYKDALDGKTCSVDGQTITNFHCRLIYYPYKSTGRSTLLWPHAWAGASFVSSPRVIVNTSRTDESPFVGTYAHEFTHVLGVSDLYCDSSYSVEPVGSWYLMASTNYNYPQSINAYFKSQFGLTGESPYGYKDDSKVRVISSSGEYLLAPANSQSGTIAFKFAERNIKVSGTCNTSICSKHNGTKTSYEEDGKEMFFVEYKKKATSQTATDYSIQSSGLIIYRVVESNHTKELGNLFPSMLGDVKFQVYVLRANGVSGTESSAVAEGGEFGAISSTSDSNKLITYYDGTNTCIKIKNNGYDSNGNAKVQFEFADDIEKFSVSGTFKVDNVAVEGASVMVAKPSSAGGYEASVDSGVKTDKNGYFFVDGLVRNSKISFLKNSKTYNTVITVNNISSYDQAISEKTIYDVTLHIYKDESSVKVPLQGVEVTNAQTNKLVGSSDADGKITLQVQLGDRFSFKLAGYNISDWIFRNIQETEYSIQGAVEHASTGIQLKFVDKNGAVLSDVQLENVTNETNKFSVSSNKNGDIYEIADGAEVGSKIRVNVENFAPMVFTIEEKDYTSVRTITLYEYQSTTIKIANVRGEKISNVSVQVDGITVGSTDLNGEILISEIYYGQKITFNHRLYRVNAKVFDGSTMISLQAEYKSVQVRLEFYKPRTFVKDNIVSVDNVSSGLTVFVESTSVNPSKYNELLCFDAYFYSAVYFNSSLYRITNEAGEYLISDKDNGVSFIIDPYLAYKWDEEEDYVVFRLFAKKLITLEGTVTFPKDAKTKKVEIKVAGKRVGETTEDGTFKIENMVEGEEIQFVCDGYTFSTYYVVESTDGEPMTIVANPKNPFEYLPIYILFGVLVLCLIIPYFAGLSKKGKKKDMVDIEKMQYDSLYGDDESSKKSKKNKKR